MYTFMVVLRVWPNVSSHPWWYLILLVMGASLVSALGGDVKIQTMFSEHNNRSTVHNNRSTSISYLNTPNSLCQQRLIRCTLQSETFHSYFHHNYGHWPTRTPSKMGICLCWTRLINVDKRCQCWSMLDLNFAFPETASFKTCHWIMSDVQI